ncbi:MAG TPA: TonB-dependent receptor [Candidatus Sulfotelmatobacter sp.]|nr:TonB-dependent receptor [Candidatus Sulfotelmatobacter sp.]
MRGNNKTRSAILFVCLLAAATAWASITGSISGIVTDPSGAVVPGASVTAINLATGVKSTVKTDGAGFYNFPNLSVGTYDVEVVQKGFKTYRQTGIALNANDVLKADVKLELGEVAEKVTVVSEAIHVETQSTQNGEVINSQKIEAVPLNGRDFTNLLSLQPGVVPFQYANALQDSNLSDRTVGGSDALNGGNQSINGQRETSNGFMVNGANVEEGKNNGTTVIPNLDSIDEFRIITNNYDAEYGNFSGGQVNVVTKSGTNSIHGSAFEFNRNTAFNARNYFAGPGQAPKLIQNQFGGTVGGPIKREKVFFFVDYQGTRKVFAPTMTSPAPSAADLTGNLSDQAVGALTGVVSTSTWATYLNSRGVPATVGEAYSTLFPMDMIPMSAWSPVARAMIAEGLIPTGTIPIPNSSGLDFSTSAFEENLRDDRGGVRMDANTRFGMLSAYYHVDDDTFTNPYPNSGATVPAPSLGAYSALSRDRAQLWVLSDTKTLGSTAVNEFRFSYLRNGAHLFTPQGGLTLNGQPITLAGGPPNGLGFTAAAGSGATFNGGIAPIVPQLEGVPNVVFANQLGPTAFGVPADSPNQFNNTFQWQDNFSKVIGRHSLKFGGQFHYDQINDRNLFGENGSFTFNGTETGSDFADFLLGAPSAFIQATRQILDSRTKYVGLYAQDSWRVTPNLTLNYGLRWEVIQPWYDTQGKIETLIPGEQSVLFPASNNPACNGCIGAPTGWVVPGDPGVPKTLAPTRYNDFSPRLGLAYSPSWDSGILGKLTGGPGKTSIRMGYGIFYTSVEDLTQFQELGDAPFGLFWFDGNSIFETPFEDRTSLMPVQRFPFVGPVVPVKTPDPTFNWAQVEPISGSPAYEHTNRTPYGEHYELSVQRQFGPNTLLSVSYVGTQGHKLLTSIEANPGNEALCLQLIADGALSNGAPCGAGGESNVYTLPLGVNYPQAAIPAVQLVPPANCGTQNLANACMVNGTYTVLAPQNGNQVFGNNPFEATIAQSSYNSLQVSVRHSGNYSTFLFGYTYSKCMDDASELIEGINPFTPKASMALCAFDVTNNFVASYETKLPFDRLLHTSSGWRNRLASGWAISGITSFASGLPVSLSFPTDNSFTGTQNTSAPIDLPDYYPGEGPLIISRNPRSGLAYFNNTPVPSNLMPTPACGTPVPGVVFGCETMGQIGTARRRFFYGPGLNNWDMALLKNTKITESKSLQFRFEAFNAWNHTQFSGQLSSGFGVFGSGNFGTITAAYDPRVLQAGLKFLF